MTGLCDAAGLDMAEIADAMLAETAAQLPRVEACEQGDVHEQPAVDSPAVGGVTKNNAASTAHRCEPQTIVVIRVHEVPPPQVMGQREGRVHANV